MLLLFQVNRSDFLTLSNYQRVILQLVSFSRVGIQSNQSTTLRPQLLDFRFLKTLWHDFYLRNVMLHGYQVPITIGGRASRPTITYATHRGILSRRDVDAPSTLAMVLDLATSLAITRNQLVMNAALPNHLLGVGLLARDLFQLEWHSRCLLKILLKILTSLGICSRGALPPLVHRFVILLPRHHILPHLHFLGPAPKPARVAAGTS